ncbi:SDR family oxidoreductase [Microlunatus soli]|uniref:2-deoxy-D-gluconate 3-dehydrogenase n=1 Tax=Microlunatus soli TaxID=630515 RepID=A0A1H1S012_9ACTN|nr:SDR family oxidoreductase [Microlunatus soli]SDS41275.1 2-deoxy-D-gluconate 3-dehydrogenase [Microlunatus soli]
MASSPFDLTGRTALVTGGGRGLGRGMSSGLLAAGADVITAQRGSVDDDLVQYATELGRSITPLTLDLGEPDQIDSAITELLAEQRIDILINNAGMQYREDAVDFDLTQFDRVLSINMRSVFQLSQLIARPMLERGHGKIINIASMVSFSGGYRVPAYAASKGAIAQLTKACCNEWAGRGVNVNAIAPGYMATDMNEALLADEQRNDEITARIPAGRWGTPDDMAGTAVFLSSSAADYLNGAIIPVDGGWLAR